MIENNDKTIETNNNSMKLNGKTDIDGVDDQKGREGSEEVRDKATKASVSSGCKVCTDEDMSTQFFASGPFYAIDSDVDRMTRNVVNGSESTDRRDRLNECNVLYAEMPQLFGSDVRLDQNHSSDDKPTNASNRSIPNGSDRGLSDLSAEHNYQFVCYNCCSPLSVGEDSPLNHNLFYISSDESKAGMNGQTNDGHRSTLTSPIMLNFCRDQAIEVKSGKDESNSCNSSERLANYTTVIKPKPVRPLMAPNASPQNAYSLRSQLSRSALPTLSFHGSTNVLTDRDESAFTQICRRRSNSEATHHYQSISTDRNRMPSGHPIDYNRPLLRHERSQSVNKAFNGLDLGLSFTKCQAISDKHLTKTDSNNTNSVYFSTNCNNFKENLSKQRTSTQTKSSEPIHMTLEEVRNIFTKNQSKRMKNSLFVSKYKRNSTEFEEKSILCKSKSKSKIKCAIESLFRTKRKSISPIPSNEHNFIESNESIDNISDNELNENASTNQSNESTSPFTHRALPPLPNNSLLEKSDQSNSKADDERQKFLDYAASIERVKDCGWYWGPISGEMAEKLLESEPCGSFIVRDSSDEHYIFSLTFKLNGLVRHVRIEHDQGNFSFGSLQKFRSNTIVDFIENAVQHSRSGRFLFFLHRRPVMGPMRVQLLHPVSRFKQIQSLQHMCRFVILKHVRRDLIEELPLPQMLKSYLNTPYYYSEELALMSKEEPIQVLDQSLPPNPNTSQSDV